jgi:hypothetical protein
MPPPTGAPIASEGRKVEIISLFFVLCLREPVELIMEKYDNCKNKAESRE